MKIDSPSTWVVYQPSLCKGCWAACCTFPVPVSTEDLYHMGYLKIEEVEGPMRKIARRLMEEGIVQSYDGRTRTFILAQKKNGRDCIFLDSNRLCKIYDRRPAVCRAFPKGGPRPGHCPAKRK